MFKKIKEYFTIKKQTREMKYILLTNLYTFVSKKESYLNLLQEIAKSDPEEMRDQFINSLAELAHNEGMKMQHDETEKE